MDLADVAEIRTRARALHDFLSRLDQLTALHRDGAITIADTVELQLTEEQSDRIGQRALDLAGKLRTLAESLPGPTGHPGAPSSDEIAAVERNPPLAVRITARLIDRHLNPMLSMPPQERADGGPGGDIAFGFDFEDADAEHLADQLATVRDQAEILIGVLEARIAR